MGTKWDEAEELATEQNGVNVWPNTIIWMQWDEARVRLARRHFLRSNVWFLHHYSKHLFCYQPAAQMH